MLYRIRNYGQMTENVDEWWCSSNNIRNHILTIKLAIYTVLVIMVHVSVGFTLPLSQNTSMGQEPYVMMFYVLWMVYFVYSGL